MSATALVQVEYKNADDWHVFSSRDLPGLYVASHDPEAAYNDVANAIEKLLQLNEGVQCRAVPQLPFTQFITWMMKKEPDDIDTARGVDSFMGYDIIRVDTPKEYSNAVFDDWEKWKNTYGGRKKKVVRRKAKVRRKK